MSVFYTCKFVFNKGIMNFPGGTRDTSSRSSRLFKKLHEARYHRDKNTEGKGPGQKVSGKGNSGGGGASGCCSSGTASCNIGGSSGVEQIVAYEVPTLSEGPSAAVPGPSLPVIKVILSCFLIHKNSIT